MILHNQKRASAAAQRVMQSSAAIWPACSLMYQLEHVCTR